MIGIRVPEDIYRSFSVAGPRIWNSLPASLRQPDIDFDTLSDF